MGANEMMGADDERSEACGSLFLLASLHDLGEPLCVLFEAAWALRLDSSPAVAHLQHVEQVAAQTRVRHVPL